jgi:hypothetical protein
MRVAIVTVVMMTVFAGMVALMMVIVAIVVVRVIDREMIPFEEARSQLLDDVRVEVFTDWLMGRVDQAEIRVNPRYGFFNEETGTVMERTSTTPLPEPSVQVEP